jgi:hypothetical protein
MSMDIKSEKTFEEIVERLVAVFRVRPDDMRPAESEPLSPDPSAPEPAVVPQPGYLPAGRRNSSNIS